MAKIDKNDRSKSNVDQSDKPGKLSILLYYVLIPLLFTVAVLLVVAYGSKINVFEKAKELTSTLPLVGTSADEKQEKVDLQLEERVVTLNAEIADKEAEVAQIQSKYEKSIAENEALLIEQQRLLDEIAVLQRAKELDRKDFQEIVMTFEAMSAKTAAPIIVKLDDTEALRVLTSMKPDVLAEILEKMSPEDAAKYLQLMSTR